MFKYTSGVVPVVAGSSLEWRVYFQTHQPSEWLPKDGIRNVAAEAEFEKVYGRDALLYALGTGLVPENGDPNFVGGSFVNGKHSTRPVYEDRSNLVSASDWPNPTKARTLNDADLAEIRKIIREELGVTN